MKVLLLGGSGLLGHNVLLTLLQQGYEVRALVRRANAIQLPNKDAFEIEVGSLLDKPTLLHAAQGCEAIINCAGVTDMSLLHYEDYLPVNRDLCQTLLQVMQQCNISTLVDVSTANTIGYGTPHHLATEADAMQEPFRSSYYARSKQESEQLLQAAARQHPTWHIIIINPGFMIGAYDVKPSSGTLLLAGYRKPLMTAPRGGKSFVAAATVASAAVNALKQGVSGEKYLLTGENMSLQEFYRLQASYCGYRQKFFYLPRWIVLLAGRVGDLLRHLGIKTQVCTRNVRQLLVMEYYNNSKALHDLTPTIVSVKEAIQAFFTWRDAR